jgi:Tfp pilus assembly protein PilN
VHYFLVTTIVLIVNVVAMAVLYLNVSNQISSNSNRMLQVQQKIKQLGDFDKHVNSAFSSDELLQKKEQLIHKLKQEQGSQSQLLSAVSLEIPNEAWLIEWIQKERSVVLNGYAVSNDILANFISILSENPMFRSVSLSSTRLKKIDGMNVYQFSLLCRLTGGINE